MGLRKKKTLIDQAAEYLDTAVDTVKPHVESAMDSAVDFVENTALPAITDAKDKVDSAPSTKSKGKKGGIVKKLVIFGILGGVVAAVVKKLQSGGDGDNWQSSYTPSPAPEADDLAGATPDEALADAVEAPVEPSTPDAPAEVVDTVVDPSSEAAAERTIGEE